MKRLEHRDLGHGILAEHGTSFTGVVRVKDREVERETGEDRAAVWQRTLHAAGRHGPNRFGFEGAKARFLKYFPEGFEDPGYLRDERDYKVRHRDWIAETCSLDDVRLAGGSITPTNLASGTNLLHLTEMLRMNDVLKSYMSEIDGFAAGAIKLADDDIANGLAQLKNVLRSHGAARWTIATYLPFFWVPERHMFLKPQVTRDFAERVGHRFAHDYEPDLVPRVYESLLDMTAETERAIADLAPRDRIDVQSFIWVVGAYRGDGTA